MNGNNFKFDTNILNSLNDEETIDDNNGINEEVCIAFIKEQIKLTNDFKMKINSIPNMNIDDEKIESAELNLNTKYLIETYSNIQSLLDESENAIDNIENSFIPLRKNKNRIDSIILEKNVSDNIINEYDIATEEYEQLHNNRFENEKIV